MERKPVQRIVVTVWSDNALSVEGPVEDPLWCIAALENAIDAVRRRLRPQVAPEGPRVVVPGGDVSVPAPKVPLGLRPSRGKLPLAMRLLCNIDNGGSALANEGTDPNSSTPSAARTFRLRYEDGRSDPLLYLSSQGGSGNVTAKLWAYNHAMSRWLGVSGLTAVTITKDVITPVSGVPLDCDLFLQLTTTNSSTQVTVHASVGS